MIKSALAHRRLDWLFPLLLAIPLGWLLWVFSGPGMPMFRLLAAHMLLAIFGIVWLVLLALAWRSRRTLTWYGVAVALTVLTYLLIAAHIPSQARWAASRPAFDQLAAQVAADPNMKVSGRVGWYEIDDLSHINGGWIVYENAGHGLVDDAGFAYLPAGPTSDLGNGAWEGPQFRHLSGPWYSWTASW